MHDPRGKIDAPFLLPPSGSSCSVERLVFFSSSRLTCAVCVKVMGVFRERRMWESFFFCSSMAVWSCFVSLKKKSVVVVGEIVLLPVLVPVLVPVFVLVEFVSSAGMPSSRTWYLAAGGNERQLGHQVGG